MVTRPYARSLVVTRSGAREGVEVASAIIARDTLFARAAAARPPGPGEDAWGDSHLIELNKPDEAAS